MNVLVVTENHTYDQPMLEPIVAALLQSIGKPNATLRFYQNPKRKRGYSVVTHWSFLERVLTQNPMTHLFLLIVDRDGEPHRRAELDDKEAHAVAMMPDRCFLAEHAHQEVEAWILIGQPNLPAGWSIQDIRNDPDVKEQFYEPFARTQGLLQLPGQGRSLLAERASYPRIRQLCPEVAGLEARILACLSNLA